MGLHKLDLKQRMVDRSGNWSYGQLFCRLATLKAFLFSASKVKLTGRQTSELVVIFRPQESSNFVTCSEVRQDSLHLVLPTCLLSMNKTRVITNQCSCDRSTSIKDYPQPYKEAVYMLVQK